MAAKPKPVHLQDKIFPRSPIHFLLSRRGRRLTGDPKKVTCGICLRMIERQKRYSEAGE